MSKCSYCGGDCPDQPASSNYLCDGFAGNIDDLDDEPESTPAFLDRLADSLGETFCGLREAIDAVGENAMDNDANALELPPLVDENGKDIHYSIVPTRLIEDLKIQAHDYFA